jgi:hypothetical protein
MNEYFVKVKTNEKVNKEYVVARIRIGLQKTSNESIIKKESGFDGIEAYMYLGVRLGGINCTVKVTDYALQMAELTEEEAWEQAERNTFEDVKFIELDQFVHDEYGIEGEEDEDDRAYILTNTDNYLGASTVLNKWIIMKFAREHHTKKVLVLPSSIHEVIIKAYRDDDIEIYSKMVREVNRVVVAEEEQLADRAYMIEI